MILSYLVVIVFFILLVKVGIKFAFPLLFVGLLASIKLPFNGSLDVASILICMAFFFSLKKRKMNREKYPFLLSTLLITISYFLSTCFAKGTPHWGYTLAELTHMLLFPYVFFLNVNDLKDVQRIYNALFFVVFLSCSVTFIEFILGKNIWQLIMNSLIGQYGWNMDGRIRYGMNRMQSIYLHSTSLGYISTLLSSFILLFVFNKSPHIFRKKNFLAVLALYFCSFFSGSRASIIPIPICLMYYLRKKWLKPKILISFVVLIPFILYFGRAYFLSIIESIVYSNSTLGSSSEMRAMQFDIALRYWQKYPLLGWGNGAIFDTVREKNGESILGAESIWLPMLVDLGLLGCLGYLSVYLSSVKAIIKRKMDVFVFLAIVLVMNTMTSTPGFDIGIVMCLILLVRRMQIINQNGGFV